MNKDPSSTPVFHPGERVACKNETKDLSFFALITGCQTWWTPESTTYELVETFPYHGRLWSAFEHAIEGIIPEPGIDEGVAQRL